MDYNREPRDCEREADRTASGPAAAPGGWIKNWILSSLIISYLIELIFTLFELDKQIKKKRYVFFDGIVFPDGKIWDGWVTDAVFVYGFMETAARGLIFLSAAWASYYGVRLRIFFVCALLEVIDMFDYWLFYNSEWFNTGIEFNHIKIGIIFFNVWKEYHTSPSLR